MKTINREVKGEVKCCILKEMRNVIAEGTDALNKYCIIKMYAIFTANIFSFDPVMFCQGVCGQALQISVSHAEEQGF